MSDHPDPARLLGGGQVLLTRDGARLVLAALWRARQYKQATDGGAAVSGDFQWVYRVCQLAASGPRGDEGETGGRPVTVRMPSSAVMVNVAEAAAIAGVSAQAVRKAIRAGRLAAERHGASWLMAEADVRQVMWRRNGSGKR